MPSWNNPPSPAQIAAIDEAKSERVSAYIKALSDFAHIEACNRGLNQGEAVSGVVIYGARMLRKAIQAMAPGNEKQWTDDILETIRRIILEDEE